MLVNPDLGSIPSKSQRYKEQPQNKEDLDLIPSCRQLASGCVSICVSVGCMHGYVQVHAPMYMRCQRRILVVF